MRLIQSTRSPTSPRLVVSLLDGDGIRNKAIYCRSDADIVSNLFMLPNSCAQSFDVCVLNAQWSVMLIVTSSTTIQYCWYLTGRSNEIDSSGFHTISHALDGCAPLDWSCVKWVPHAMKFIVLHSGGCYHTNAIRTENEPLLVGSKKMTVISEIGSQNRLLYPDESVVVGLHLLHANSSEALLVMQSKNCVTWLIPMLLVTRLLLLTNRQAHGIACHPVRGAAVRRQRHPSDVGTKRVECGTKRVHRLRPRIRCPCCGVCEWHPP